MSDFINTADVIGDDTITKIRDYAFYKCTELAILEAPNVTEIGQRAALNSALTVVDFPKVKKIGNNAFENSVNLKKINLPLVEELGGYNFKNSIVVNVVFPKLKIMPNAVFQWCYSLEIVDCHELTTMQGPFERCNAFKALIIRTPSVCAWTVGWGLPPPITSGTAYIYVPSALIEEYKAATNWSTVASQFRAIEDYTVDGTVTGDLDESKI